MAEQDLPSRFETPSRQLSSPSSKSDLTRDGRVPDLTLEQEEDHPPALPPRTPKLDLLDARPRDSNNPRTPPKRPNLLSQATTAVSRPDIHTLTQGEQFREGATTPSKGTPSSVGARGGRSGNASDDAASLRSYAPAWDGGEELESIVGDVLGGRDQLAWRSRGLPDGMGSQHEYLFPEDHALDDAFEQEFTELAELEADFSNQDLIISQWKAKLKHFLILSSAGKPIYSRHGDDQLISHYIGVIQTLISFYQGAEDDLRGFTAGNARFVINSKGHLHLVAISRLGESDSQLRTQLEALYMQILSTLTLPKLKNIFISRPSSDLRRPLEGTESLLSALADGFTRGSPSTLLSGLECLRLRKTNRQTINNTLLKVRSPNLLYGLIVAGGRLVSVIRPKKHSLHPGDLHLIFNMLFEAGSIRAGEGENWIPICLPGFNNTGYIYMYVSFLGEGEEPEGPAERPSSSSGKDDEVAVILISTSGEGFYELRQMRDDLVENLEANGGLDMIRQSLQEGRPRCTDIIPGTVLRHFLYKSRTNVQFTMPSYSPYFNTPLVRRHLIIHYAHLHAVLHNRSTSLKLHHAQTATSHSLAWITPIFELYAIAPPNTPRTALAAAANKVVGWAKREEARVFIIGGAVF